MNPLSMFPGDTFGAADGRRCGEIGTFNDAHVRPRRSRRSPEIRGEIPTLPGQGKSSHLGSGCLDYQKARGSQGARSIEMFVAAANRPGLTETIDHPGIETRGNGASSRWAPS